MYLVRDAFAATMAVTGSTTPAALPELDNVAGVTSVNLRSESLAAAARLVCSLLGAVLLLPACSSMQPIGSARPAPRLAATGVGNSAESWSATTGAPPANGAINAAAPAASRERSPEAIASASTDGTAAANVQPGVSDAGSGSNGVASGANPARSSEASTGAAQAATTTPAHTAAGTQGRRADAKAEPAASARAAPAGRERERDTVRHSSPASVAAALRGSTGAPDLTAGGAGGASSEGTAAAPTAAGSRGPASGGVADTSTTASNSAERRAIPVGESSQSLATAESDADAARRGRVETPVNRVLIAEGQNEQTLGGTLPLSLDVDDHDHFEFDRYDLTPVVRARLDALADKLKAAPYDKLFLLGYTDRIGTEDYNQKLSEKRAWAVAGYLMDRGVPAYKLDVRGRGDSAPVTGADDCRGLRREALIECLQRDRRVEVHATVKSYDLKVQ